MFDLPTSRMNGNSAEMARAPAQHGLVTREEVQRQEREAIAAALRQTNGKVSGPGGAAELLGIKPTTLASRIAALGINRRALK
jgi:transcriptional regulator with GAF, ATPase, and Fis domain